MARRVDPFTKQAFGPQTLVGQKPIMARILPRGSPSSAPAPLGLVIPDEVADRSTPQLMAGYGQFNFKAANCTVYSWGDTSYGACWTDADEGGNSAGYASFPDSISYFNRPEEMHVNACIRELQPTEWMASSWAIDCEGYLWASGDEVDQFLTNDPLGDGGIYGYADGPETHPLFTGGIDLPDYLFTAGNRGPLRFGGFGKVTAAAATFRGVIFRREDGSWAGVGDTSNFIPSSAPPDAYAIRECDLMPAGVDIVAVYPNLDVLGSDTYYALSADGDLYSWGNVFSTSTFGRFSWDDTPPDEEFSTPGLIDLPAPVVKTAGGYEFQIALLDNGELWAWGEAYKINNFRGGHFGMDDATAKPLAVASGGYPGPGSAYDFPEFFTPVQLPIDNVADFACRRGGTVVVKTDGTVWSTGFNENWIGTGLDPPDIAGQFSSLGYINSEIAGDTQFQYEFKQVTDPEMTSRNALLVCCASSNDDATVVYCDDGTLISFGSDFEVQLARGETPPSSNHSYYGPGVVSSERQKLAWSANAITAGGKSSLAERVGIGSSQTTYVWGLNDYGELLLAATDLNDPQPSPDLNIYTQRALGDGHTVLLDSDGSVWTIGRNSSGQLGDGTEDDSDTVIQVAGLSGVVEVAAGYAHSMALKSDGTVWAWGNDGLGQIGNGFGGPSDTTVPNQVVIEGGGGSYTDLTGIVKIWAGPNSGYAQHSDGTIYAWGQLTPKLSEIDLDPIFTQTEAAHALVDDVDPGAISDLAAGNQTLMYLMPDGTVKVASFNMEGQMGRGDDDVNPTGEGYAAPVTVPGLSGVSAIAAGDSHCLALLADGSVKAWGFGDDGEIGDDSCGSRFSPTDVIGISGVIEIACGIYHSLALQSDSSIWAWGKNSDGQLGDDTFTNRCAPVGVFLLGDKTVFDADPPGICAVDRPDEDLPPPDTELPPVEDPPTIDIPVPDINLDTGIDVPPVGDITFPDPGNFPMPPIGVPGPGMPDIDFPDFPDLGKWPFDDISFPDPSFDLCNFPGMGGCEPGPGTGSGAPGGRKPDGKHPPGHGGGGGGGNSGRRDTFDKQRCYTNADVVTVIRALFRELGLADGMIHIPPGCDETFTKCFAKGSRKWDAIWYLSDLCGRQPIEPGPGPIVIVPVVPNDTSHTIHAYNLEGTYPLFSLEREADDAENYFAVEVYRLAVTRNGRVIVPEASKVAIVPGSFTADPSSWLRIEVKDPNMSEAVMEQRAITEAQKAGRMTYRVTATTLYAPAISLLDQVRIINPWRGLDQVLMVTEKSYDISESGRFTIVTARHHPALIQPGVPHITRSVMEIGDNPPIQPYGA